MTSPLNVWTVSAVTARTVVPGAAAAVALALGLAGALPGPVAVGLAGLSTAGYAVPLLNRARRPVDRTVLPLAIGVLFAAVASAGSSAAYLFAPHTLLGDVPLPAEIPLVGLFFTVGGYLLGLLRPGRSATLMSRIRAGLNGLSVSLSVVYTVWLLVFSVAGIQGGSLTAALLAALAITVTVSTGLNPAQHPAGLPWCALGASLSIGGVAGLVISLDYGATRLADVGTVEETAAPRSPGYPLLALPLLGASLATAYHLAQTGRFDSVSIALSIAVIVVVTARETLAAIDLRRYAARLATQGEQLRTLVLGSQDVAVILDDNLVVRWQSPAAARQFGLSDQDVVGRRVSALLHPEDAGRLTAHLAGDRPDPIEVRLRDGFGRWRETEWNRTGPDPGRPGGSLVVHIHDVSQRRELERTVRQAAYTDHLTSLANRKGLTPVPESGALIVVELYGLAGVHDVHGPDLGDAVLVEAARRLRTEVARTDVPARLGESRFAVLTRSGAVPAHLLASRLLNVLTAPYHAPGAVAHVSAGAGLADLVADRGIEEILRRAELALRATRPGNPIEWYEESMEARLLRRSAIQQELPGALGRGELDLAYQPIIELPGGRPVGVEALLRWRHPKLGSVPPAELLPIAEELGLLEEIGHWVLHWACRQLSRWIGEHHDLWIAVNVSTAQLAAEEFMATVGTALETHLVPPSSLMIEVAEPGLVAARDSPSAFADVVAHLGQLRALGVRTAVDNFGTGPTSLSQLRVLPVDLLKIDREVFATPSGRPVAPNAIIDVLVKLGTRLGIEIVAQGVESESDLDTARAAGCRYAQGYLVGRPAPPERLEAYLDSHTRPDLP